MRGSLLHWAGLNVALPSRILQRLESGLLRRKRYLTLWVRRWLMPLVEKREREREALQLLAFALDVETYQTPSDPGLRRAILRAIAALNERDQAIIRALAQKLGATEIADELGTTPTTARKQIERARQAFREELRSIFRGDENSWSRFLKKGGFV